MSGALTLGYSPGEPRAAVLWRRVQRGALERLREDAGTGASRVNCPDISNNVELQVKRSSQPLTPTIFLYLELSHHAETRDIDLVRGRLVRGHNA